MSNVIKPYGCNYIFFTAKCPDFQWKRCNKKPSITNTIEELKFELHRLHYKELKLNDTKEFQIYKQLCKYLDSKQ